MPNHSCLIFTWSPFKGSADPSQCDLQVTSSVGSIQVAWVTGDVEARTTSGPIEMRHIDGEVTAKTLDGAIELAQVRGPIVARTEHGSVFGRLEVGNDRGWAKYDITIGPLPVTEDSIRHAMDMHLSFYDDGESAKEYAS